MVGPPWANPVQFILGTYPIKKWANWTKDQLVHGLTRQRPNLQWVSMSLLKTYFDDFDKKI